MKKSRASKPYGWTGCMLIADTSKSEMNVKSHQQQSYCWVRPFWVVLLGFAVFNCPELKTCFKHFYLTDEMVSKVHTVKLYNMAMALQISWSVCMHCTTMTMRPSEQRLLTPFRANNGKLHVKVRKGLCVFCDDANAWLKTEETALVLKWDFWELCRLWELEACRCRYKEVFWWCM